MPRIIYFVKTTVHYLRKQPLLQLPTHKPFLPTVLCTALFWTVPVVVRTGTILTYSTLHCLCWDRTSSGQNKNYSYLQYFALHLLGPYQQLLEQKLFIPIQYCALHLLGPYQQWLEQEQFLPKVLCTAFFWDRTSCDYTGTILTYSTVHCWGPYQQWLEQELFLPTVLCTAFVGTVPVVVRTETITTIKLK